MRLIDGRAPNLFYPIFVSEDELRFPQAEWNDEAKQWELNEEPLSHETVLPSCNA